MHGSWKRSLAITTAALALLMVFGFSAPMVDAASPAPAASTNTTMWAYGNWTSVSFGPVPWVHAGWVREGQVTLGFSVVLTQVDPNANAPTFELEVNQTVGVLFAVEYCTPSCSNPTEYMNVSYHQWEHTNSFVNLTDQGSVAEAAGAVPALAVLNSSTRLTANLTNTYGWLLPGSGVMSGRMVGHSAGVYANVASAADVSFAAPHGLGLFPLQLNSSSGQEWTSSSPFNASGSADFTYHLFDQSTAGMNWNLGPKTSAGSVTGSGNISLSGAYSSLDDREWSGLRYPALQLSLTGPFSVREGFVFVPVTADLFGSSSQTWSSNETGSTLASMASLDATEWADGHFGLGASSWRFTPGSSDSVNSLAGPTGLAPAATASSDPVGSGSYTLQGTPETVPTAQKTGDCVASPSGTGCPLTGNGSHGALRGLVEEIAVSGILAAVVATVVAVVVVERRRLPPPAYPNAHLYPPGSTGPFAPMGAAQRPETPSGPPPEEDPLDHLW